uniref:histidine phosphatase family protein n=1 Tax=Ningiella ruwaisensis TaxID=2364274 RepID=UPI00109EE4CD|nr:histidine phosphatase family protein [Ningiella ruwaisensis]
MSELYLVRHAQASFGSEDYDKLSATGHTQSRLLGEYFKARDIRFDKVITGDMLRHKETAQGIYAHTEHGSEPGSFVTDKGWNEFDFNAVISAYLEAHPEHRPVENAPRSDWYRVLKSAMLAWSNKRITTSNEAWLDFEERVKSAAQRVYQDKSKRILVVSSGGAIAVCLMQILGINIQKAVDFNLQIKNTSIHHVYFNENSQQLSSFNNVPHLDIPEYLHLVTYS